MAPTTRAQKREGKEPLPLKAKKPKKSAKAPLVEKDVTKEEDVPVGNGHPISNGTEDKVADEKVPAPASIEEKNDADGPEEIKDENVKEEQERVEDETKAKDAGDENQKKEINYEKMSVVIEHCKS